MHGEKEPLTYISNKNQLEKKVYNSNNIKERTKKH